MVIPRGHVSGDKHDNVGMKLASAIETFGAGNAVVSNIVSK